MSDTLKLTILDETNPKALTELGSDDFRSIRERFESSGTVVTLCLPMEKAGSETRKNHIVFKNAVSEAQDRLANTEGEQRELDFALRKLLTLDDPTAEFWQQQQDGLVMFIDGGEDAVCVRLPFSVGPDVEIGDSPYVRPLHRLSNPSRYYVLALDLNELKLFEATRWNLRPLDLENVPTSLDEAMKYDDPEKSLQFRSGHASKGKAGPAPTYHGHGVTTDATENEKIRRYFEMVSQNIADNFPDRQTELILLGPGSERSRYREVNHYEKLGDHEIDLNPSNRSHEDLTRIVGEEIEKLGDQELASSLENLGSHIANDSGSVDLKDIVKAVLSGKVDTFFYKAGERRYGSVSEDSFKVDVSDEPAQGATELVGYCAERAIDTGAKVRVVESDDLKLPDNSPVAAAYRY